MQNIIKLTPKERVHMKNSSLNVSSFGYPTLRCKACAKHSKSQCKNPAVTGYKVCRMHGARGGPKTEEGINRIAEANTTHGRETRIKRLTRQEIKLRLELAIALGYSLGMFG